MCGIYSSITLGAVLYWEVCVHASVRWSSFVYSKRDSQCGDTFAPLEELNRRLDIGRTNQGKH